MKNFDLIKEGNKFYLVSKIDGSKKNISLDETSKPYEVKGLELAAHTVIEYSSEGKIFMFYLAEQDRYITPVRGAYFKYDFNAGYQFILEMLDSGIYSVIGVIDTKNLFQIRATYGSTLEIKTVREHHPFTLVLEDGLVVYAAYKDSSIARRKGGLKYKVTKKGIKVKQNVKKDKFLAF